MAWWTLVFTVPRWPGTAPLGAPSVTLPRISRERILDIIAASPGLPVGEVLQRTGIAAGTLYYHLRRLETSGEIRTVVAGRRRLVFPGGEDDHVLDAHALSLLRSPTAQSIAAAILERPHCKLSDVMSLVSGSPRVIYYHVRRMREAGMILSSSYARYRNLAPAPDLAILLATVRAEEANGRSSHDSSSGT